MEAIVEPHRIVILGSSSLPKEKWEALLNDLKAEHVPSFTPPGQRMLVTLSPEGRTDAFIYRTNRMTDDEIVQVLSEYNIPSQMRS